MHEYLEKNDIWVFREGQLKILYSELYKLKDLAKKNCPMSIRGKKTAVVSETGIHNGLAVLYAKISKDLLREIKAFSHFKSAEKWISA